MKKFISFLIICFIASVSLEAQVDRSKMPKPGPAPKINLGKPQTFELGNGLKVLVVEDKKLPRFSANLSISNAPQPQGDKVGISGLVSAMMNKGTTNMDKDTYAEAVDLLGANISNFSSGFIASGLSKYFDEIMNLAVDAALNPLFTQEELEAERKKAIEGLKAEEKSVTAIAGRVGDALVYSKKHPYGEYETEESLNSITLDDIKEYYADFFVPANAYLVIVGDVDFKDVEKKVKRAFAPWTKATPPNASLPKVNDVQYTQINFVDMPNAVQSYVSAINVVNTKMSDDDYHARLLANEILGGSFSSYLNMNLREDKGYTYGARSSLGTNRFTSTTFRTSVEVRNEVTDSAIVETLKEINRIREELVDPKKLEDVKSKYVGNFVMATERPSTIANYALNIELNDLPANFYETFLDKINAVTPEDLQKVANKYFKSDNLRVLVVGKASEVLDNLEKMQYKGKKLPIFYFDKHANKTEKPVGLSIPEGVSVESVLDNYIAALGGKEVAQKINTIYLKGSAELQGMQLGITRKVAKDQFVEVVEMMGNVLSKQVYNKGNGYVIQQGQRMEASPDVLGDLALEAKVIPELNPKAFTMSGVEEVDGAKAYVLKSGDKKYFYDAETGLKIQESLTTTQQGQTFTNTMKFNNYKDFGGMKYFSQMVQSV
ncbi:MAG: pitrilysin family protein, partial [Flavobacteriaceae bacterium]|nr:pitrilysin family protein [Flavobacteriaceae bacterium]